MPIKGCGVTSQRRKPRLVSSTRNLMKDEKRDGKNIAVSFQPKCLRKECPERCLVRLYQLYKELRHQDPKSPNFCLSVNHNPRTKQWFADSPMSINRIAGMIPRIAKEANLTGKYTDHSVRCTICSQLLNREQFRSVTVAQLSGHKIPHSLMANMDAQQEMCDMLQKFSKCKCIPRSAPELQSSQVHILPTSQIPSLPASPNASTQHTFTCLHHHLKPTLLFHLNTMHNLT